MQMIAALSFFNKRHFLAHLTALYLCLQFAELQNPVVLPNLVSGQGSPSFCQVPSLATPEQFFGFRSSLFQLFTQFKINCAGYLSRWAMISRTPGGIGLHLSVWREQPSATSQTLYRLVGKTQLPPYAVTPNTWFEYLVPDPFPVQVNDVIAIYYGDWEEPWSHNGFIPVTNASVRLPRLIAQNFAGRTLVIQKDADAISREIEANGGVVDFTNAAVVTSRFPALIAFIDRNFALPTNPPTLPPTTPFPTFPTLPTPQRPICRTCVQPVQTTPTTRATPATPAPTRPTPVPTTTVRSSCQPRCGSGGSFNAAAAAPPMVNQPLSNSLFADGGHSTRCFAPMRAAGNCNFTINKFSTKYFFNVPIRECDLFWFFEDCVRTSNLYSSKAECESMCREFITPVIVP